MIDMHVHVADPELPGSKPFPDYFKDAQATAVALEAHMQASGVTQVLAMGSLHTGEHDPLGVHMSLRVAALLDGVFVAGVIDPRKTDDAHFERVEAVLQTGKLKALKAYLGYLHFGPEHPNYRRYYALAARYRLPVVFHTGDTYALKAKVKYAHPLRVDEVAVDYPGVSFVMAHAGCPWLDTAAEVIYKNDNVWADVSGLSLIHI